MLSSDHVVGVELVCADAGFDPRPVSSCRHTSWSGALLEINSLHFYIRTVFMSCFSFFITLKYA